jgi:lysozyme family protein
MPDPTAHDRTFIPYPLGLDPKFEKCLPDVEEQEGTFWKSGAMPKAAYSDDAHDPGGKTGEGIIQKEYDAKRKQWGLPTQWVFKMSKDEERTIYYTDYWLPYCPNLPEGLDLEVFDNRVNEGDHRAIVLLQLALRVKPDGVFGPVTQSAIDTAVAVGSVMLIIDRYKVAREAFYHGLSTFKYFGTGWMRRSEEIAKQASEMVA